MKDIFQAIGQLSLFRKTRTLGSAIALGLALGLSGCGGDGSGDDGATDTPMLRGGLELEDRRAGAPRAEAEPEEFGVLRTATDDETAVPTMCLVFNAPLDSAVDYAPFVSGPRPLSFQVDGARLCMGGLVYGEESRITLREGLPSAGGDALAREEVLTVSFEDRPAFVGFAGDGIILPRIDADGLAIQTINVDTVDITISRVDDRALIFRSITTGFQASEGSWDRARFNARPRELGIPVWEGSVSTDAARNAATTTVLPLAETIGTLTPGAYYVELQDAEATEQRRRNPAAAARWLVVTDLALTTYRSDDGALVTVRSLDTARPLSGVTVDLVAQSNEVLLREETGADGQVTLSRAIMAGDEGNRPRMVMAYGPDGDFAFLDLNRSPVDLSSQPISGRAAPDQVDGFIYFDRGIYRPGEAVHATALLRSADGIAIEDRSGALELVKPSGLVAATHRFDGAPDAGGVSHTFDLPAASPRGQWRARLTIDGLGTVSTERFSVEDFVPQRVALTLTPALERPVLLGETRAIEAVARFLYGAPGAGLNLTGTVRVEPEPNPFPQYDGFRFGLDTEQFRQEQFTLEPTVADGEGRGTLIVDPARRGALSSFPLRLRTVIEVEEPGGRVVADDVRLPYRPRDIYLGLKPGFDGRATRGTAIPFMLQAVDAEGNPEDAPLVSWRLIRKDYDYDWFREPGGQWRWRRSERTVLIEEGVLNIGDEGTAEINLQPLDWGDYSLIASSDGEDLASTQFWVGWGGRTVAGTEAPDEIRVSAPDTAPAIGETATVAIRAPYAGMAEIVVATDRILSVQQTMLTEEGTDLDLPVTEEWGAGAYVMVTVYTPRDAVTQPRPRRAVGVAYVETDKSDRTLSIDLDVGEVVLPNQRLDLPVTVSGADRGEAVYATIAAVDEGILLLTNHQSPDPMRWFFGKTAMTLSLYDDYGRLLDPNQGAAAALREGGDQIGGAGLSVVPTESVALYSGIVEIDRDGQATVPLTLPDFNGELRLMAVAWTEDALGQAAQPLTVRDDVPAELILPRFLAPGDTALATATVDNVAGAPGAYEVQFRSSGAALLDDTPVTLTLDEGAREERAVQMTAGEIGIADLAIDVVGPEEYRVTSGYLMEVRSGILPERTVQRLEVPASGSVSIDPALADQFVGGSLTRTVSAAATPIDTSSIALSLYSYPYACSEQITSRAIPALYLTGLAQLAGGDGADDAMTDRLVVQETVETLLARQSADGAFGLWRIGDRRASPWLGAYVTDFLLRAREAGYPVPEAAIDRALRPLRQFAEGQFFQSSGYDVSAPDGRYTADTDRRKRNRAMAYALYVLAKAESVDASRLRYMHDRELSNMESALSRAHLAGALTAIGDRSRAANAFNAATDVLGYDNEGDWYQSPLRDQAGVIALAAEAGAAEIVSSLLPGLVSSTPEVDRMMTQEKAFVILAARETAGDDGSLSLTLGDGDFDGMARMVEPSTDVSIMNNGASTVYLTVLTEGVPTSPPSLAASLVAVDKRITTLDGAPVDIASVSRGDRMIVTLTVAPGRASLASYIVEDLLPAGLEIEAIVTEGEAGPSGPYAFIGGVARTEVAEARDDRFVAAFDGRSGPTYRFAYIARAVTPGEFLFPAAYVEDMYRTDVFARSTTQRISIAP